MNKFTKMLGLLAAVSVISGCAAMKSGFENLNKMAEAQGAKLQTQQLASWKADIKNGHYSGKVRVAMVPRLPEKGIVKDKAIANFKKYFGNHAQIELLDDASVEKLKQDNVIPSGSLVPSLVNSKRRIMSKSVEVDAILIVGLTLEKYTGINQSTGKIGEGAKVVCWDEYMVIGGPDVTKGRFEDTNIFKNEVPVQKAAASFHDTVLNTLMIELLKERVAKAEGAQK